MNKYEALKELLNSMEVEFYENNDGKNISIRVINSGCSKVGGYTGYCTTWLFDSNSKEFIQMRIAQ